MTEPTDRQKPIGFWLYALQFDEAASRRLTAWGGLSKTLGQ
jgi:hypothetical protein